MAGSVNYADLLGHCTAILSSFNSEKASVDAHTAQYLKFQRSLSQDDSAVTFVTEVFSGCVQFRKLIKIVTDNFYLKIGRNFKRTDVGLFQVLAYLSMFRLEELGIGSFRKLINTQSTAKMHKFLTFMFDDMAIKTWISEEWCKVYDQTFVQTNVVSPLLHLHSQMQEVIAQLSDKLDNITRPRRVQAATKPKPFNLTKPRPRDVPTPEQIPKLKPHRPVPESTYSAPSQLESIAKAREANKKKATDLLDDVAKSSPACAVAQKSERALRLMEKIREEEDAKLDFNSAKALPVPVAVTDNISIKLNTAAILREGALFQRREEEERRKLGELVAGGKDASEFLRWQDDNKRRKLEDELAEIERRHLIGQISHEEAILARQQLGQGNRQRVLEMKEESSRLMQIYLQQRLEEEQGMRKLVEEVISGHQNTKESMAKMREIKQKIVKEVAKESQELLRRALEEAEEEMKRKVELIRQIKAFDRTPTIRARLVDLTSTTGLGFLCEMSVAELRERLALLRVAEEEEEEKRRHEIVAGKKAKERMIVGTLGSIARCRAEQSRLAAAKQERMKKESQTRLEVVDSKVQSLQRRLEAKRAERQRIMADLQTPSGKSDTRKSSAKKETEERRWKEFEMTRERSARTRAREAELGISKMASSASSTSRNQRTGQLATS
eukprot:m.258268 g.258268  ORF g.258268 m.258268 type:complete len:669 (+) comp40413_c2_seq41:4483-6489(+)